MACFKPYEQSRFPYCSVKKFCRLKLGSQRSKTEARALNSSQGSYLTFRHLQQWHSTCSYGFHQCHTLGIARSQRFFISACHLLWRSLMARRATFENRLPFVLSEKIDSGKILHSVSFMVLPQLFCELKT